MHRLFGSILSGAAIWTEEGVATRGGYAAFKKEGQTGKVSLL
jgi:hypothetical protein